MHFDHTQKNLFRQSKMTSSEIFWKHVFLIFEDAFYFFFEAQPPTFPENAFKQTGLNKLLSC